MNQTYITILVGAGAGLIVFARSVFKDGRAHRKDLGKRLEAVNLKPAASRSVDFPYHPGEPEGYAGFTDYHAMLQTITDDLVERDTEWQFRTIGFAKGFLNAVLARAGDLGNARGVFRVSDAKEGDAEAIEWMVLMQKEGTDAASPSTSNLSSTIQKVASEIYAAGPCRIKYWNSIPEDRGDASAEPGMSSGRLIELGSLMRNAERRGEVVGAGAQLMSLDTRHAV